MISPEALKFYPLFACQDSDLLMQIAMLAGERTVEAGQPLWYEGDVAKTLYLILEGSVILTIEMGEKTEDLEPIGKDELVGWSSIVQPHIYKMSAYTGQKSRLITFDAEKLRILLENTPDFGYHFMKKLAEVIGERYIGKCVQLMSLVES
jgi:CRP/FNR family cyclic AMP-dependent transcriptional regulator